MADEAGHRDCRAVGRSLRQRHEGVRLALPCACRGRRACLRGEPIGYEHVVLALIAERVDRVQQDVRILVAERGHHERAACSGHAPPDPPFQAPRAGPSASGPRARPAGARSRRAPSIAEPAPASARAARRRTSGSSSLMAAATVLRVRACAAISAAIAFRRDCRRVGGPRPTATARSRSSVRSSNGQQLAVQPRERLEAPERPDSRRRARPDRRREKSFGLPKLACRRVGEPAERPVRAPRERRRDSASMDSLRLLLRGRRTGQQAGRAAPGGARWRPPRRTCGSRACRYGRRSVTTSRRSRRPRARTAARCTPRLPDLASRQQRAQIVRQRRACILDRQDADETRRRLLSEEPARERRARPEASPGDRPGPQ